jgi:molybdopterin molybdotransferase
MCCLGAATRSGAAGEVAGFSALLAEAYPAEGARLAGQDAAEGTLLLSAGERVTALHALVLREAGIAGIQARRAAVAVTLADEALGRWLGDRAGPAPQAALVVTDDPALFVADVAGPALVPGHGAALGHVDGVPAVLLPQRFDAAIGAALGLAVPCLARLAGLSLAGTRLPLAARLVSAVGIAEIALLRRREGAFEPVQSGEITLAGLRMATHWTLLPPESEGVPAGMAVSASPLGH